MKKKIMTVNKHKPQIAFALWHSNEKNYCPVGNREEIGICNARTIVKKVLKLSAANTELVLDKLATENKFLVFGKHIDPFFVNKPGKYANAFFLGVFDD